MSATDKLSALLAQCKCGVYITVNAHRDVYDKIEDWLREHCDEAEVPMRIAPDVRAQIVASDSCVEIQAYPNTPIGFAIVVHYSMDGALDTMLTALSTEEE